MHSELHAWPRLYSRQNVDYIRHTLCQRACACAYPSIRDLKPRRLLLDRLSHLVGPPVSCYRVWPGPVDAYTGLVPITIYHDDIPRTRSTNEDRLIS